MTYSPEQIEELASAVAAGERFTGPEAAAALRAYAATLRQAARVDEGMVSVTCEDGNNYCRILTVLGMEEEGDPVAKVEQLVALEAALSAQPASDPTDPGHDVEVLREHVRHLERRIRELHAQPAERQGEGNKTMLQIMEGSAWRASLIGLCVAPKEADVSTPEKAAANVRARLARSATPVGVPDRALLRAIVDAAWNEATESRQVPSTEWADRIIDGVLAAPSAPHVNAGLGIPSCGKPLCSENDHHPLCPSAPQGVE